GPRGTNRGRPSSLVFAVPGHLALSRGTAAAVQVLPGPLGNPAAVGFHEAVAGRTEWNRSKTVGGVGIPDARAHRFLRIHRLAARRSLAAGQRSHPLGGHPGCSSTGLPLLRLWRSARWPGGPG